MNEKTLCLVDGENLVLRFQEMQTRINNVSPRTIHKKDFYVWHPEIIECLVNYDIFRISYYITCQGAVDTIEQIKKEISKIEYQFNYAGNEKHGTLVPYVFKKETRSIKNKSVDTNLTIDALRHTYNNSIDKIILVSGDSDYIPLVKEIMNQGKRVIIWALSSGLNPQMTYIGDRFKSLDEIFFPSH